MSQVDEWKQQASGQNSTANELHTTVVDLRSQLVAAVEAASQEQRDKKEVQARLKVVVADLQSTQQALEDALHEHQASTETQSFKRKRLSRALRDQHECLQQLRQEYQALRSHVGGSIQELSQSMLETLTSLANRSDSRQARLAAAHKMRVAFLRSQHERQLETALEHATAPLQKQVAAQQSQLHVLREERTLCEARLGMALEDATSSRRQLEHARRLATAHTVDMANKAAAREESLNRRIGALEVELASTKETATEAGRVSEAAESTCTELRGQVETLSTKLSQATTSLSTATQESTQLQQELQDMTSRRTVLEQQVNALEHQVSVRDEALREHQTQSSQLEAQRSQLEVQLQALQRHEKQRTHQLRDLRVNLETMRQQIHGQVAALAALRSATAQDIVAMQDECAGAIRSVSFRAVSATAEALASTTPASVAKQLSEKLHAATHRAEAAEAASRKAQRAVVLAQRQLEEAQTSEQRAKERMLQDRRACRQALTAAIHSFEESAMRQLELRVCGSLEQHTNRLAALVQRFVGPDRPEEIAAAAPHLRPLIISFVAHLCRGMDTLSARVRTQTTASTQHVERATDLVRRATIHTRARAEDRRAKAARDKARLHGAETHATSPSRKKRRNSKRRGSKRRSKVGSNDEAPSVVVGVDVDAVAKPASERAHVTEAAPAVPTPSPPRFGSAEMDAHAMVAGSSRAQASPAQSETSGAREQGPSTGSAEVEAVDIVRTSPQTQGQRPAVPKQPSAGVGEDFYEGPSPAWLKARNAAKAITRMRRMSKLLGAGKAFAAAAAGKRAATTPPVSRHRATVGGVHASLRAATTTTSAPSPEPSVAAASAPPSGLTVTTSAAPAAGAAATPVGATRHVQVSSAVNTADNPEMSPTSQRWAALRRRTMSGALLQHRQSPGAQNNSVASSSVRSRSAIGSLIDAIRRQQAADQQKQHHDSPAQLAPPATTVSDADIRPSSLPRRVERTSTTAPLLEALRRHSITSHASESSQPSPSARAWSSSDVSSHTPQRVRHTPTASSLHSADSRSTVQSPPRTPSFAARLSAVSTSTSASPAASPGSGRSNARGAQLRNAAHRLMRARRRASVSAASSSTTPPSQSKPDDEVSGFLQQLRTARHNSSAST